MAARCFDSRRARLWSLRFLHSVGPPWSPTLKTIACAPVLLSFVAAFAQDSSFDGLSYREVGPYRGGRSAAVAGIPSKPNTYYFGAAGGGVWKTGDGGRSWDNVSDGFFGGSIGAVAVSEWDPNVVYVGGGEKTVRGNVSHGDGIWRSDDAGKTWKHVGLGDSRRIPRIRIHPKNPDRVWVAALGHLFGPNAERGVFRSDDGGATWDNVLFVSDEVGAVDLALDPTNPRVLYACFWRVKRTPWSLESGGEGSGIWKTTDGGDTWTEITRNPGLPAGLTGISGITVSPSNPENLYAIVEAEDGGVFRSRNGGSTWSRTNSERSLRQRAWYYTRIYADPVDEEQVYVLNVQFHRSKDGGTTFSRVSVPHGDNHDLWIAPDDPERMIQSNDGGANVSSDGGATWSPQDNQPTAQMYRVSTDDDFPYRLLGGQQDNSAVRVRSRNVDGFAIDERQWESTAGGESGHIVAVPGRPARVFGGSYGGFLTMRDHVTGETRNVHAWPDNPMGWGARELRYRFQWNFPLFFSPHPPHALYAAANVLFRSTDEGANWTAISPDLTRNDASKLGSSGGPITKDNTSVEYYATIFAALESPHEEGVLWAGSDDGRVHVTRDGGVSWTDVSPTTLPPWTQVNGIEAHPTEPGGLYLAGTRYKLDDFEPYLFATLDYGATWREISAGIPPGHFTRAIRADPERAGLLYAGTERGVHVSFDDGASWSTLQLDLPVVPVTDLAVKENDLVVATQGRGYWILDDLSVLHQWDAGQAGETVLYEPRPALRLGMRSGNATGRAGSNPAAGARIAYRVGESVEANSLRLEIIDSAGELVRAFAPEPDADAQELALPTEPGLHRIAWNLSYPGAESFDGMVLWNRSLGGPRAVPGEYTVRLNVGETQVEVPLRVLADPRASATAEDYAAQFAFVLAVRDKLTAAHRGIERLRSARDQLEALAGRLDGDAAEAVDGPVQALIEELGAVERALYQTQNESPQDPLNFPIRLTDKLAGLRGVVARGDFAPTAQAEAVRLELTAAIDAEMAKLDALLGERLDEVNQLVRDADIPAVGGG
ncbi:MAG: glycosyl hydrolase [bacterium]|nr:glycosyl hydrolase [bacterium]